MTGGLETIPVIEIRNYTDPTGDFHERYRSAIIRERMLNAWGDAGTHVNWTGPNNQQRTAQMRVLALTQLEAWLDNLEAAGGPGDRERTIAARPASLEDGCFDSAGAFIEEVLDYEDAGSACNTLYPYHSQPRAEAGMPLAADGMKCQLAEPVRSDYPAMTDAQWASLTGVFATGVCDWTKPSQGFTELEGTWLDFGETETVDLSGVDIEGTARVGGELTAVAESATSGAEFSYQWIADGTPIEGATGATFVIPAELDKATIAVRVTASADGFVPASTVSDSTQMVRFDNSGGEKS